MASEVTIAGHKFPKWVVWASAIGGTGAVYLAYRAHASTAASSATSAATGTDPVTGLPYSEDNGIDPITGQTYLAEAQEYGSVSAAEAAVSQDATGAGYGYDSGYSESGLAAGEPDYYSSTAQSTYASNADWVAAVTAGLEQLGYSASDVNAAVAGYLAGLPLTSTQAGLVQTALAEFGNPPTGSYSIIAQSTAAGATTTGQSTSTGSTTGTSSASTTTGTPETAPTNVRATTSGAVTTISWQAVGGATSYGYQLAEPSGAQYRDGTVTVPSGSFDNLVDIGGKGKQWHFKCRAINSAGSGPWSAVIAFTP